MAEGVKFEEVNIDLGDDMSQMFDIAARATYDNIPGAVWRANEPIQEFPRYRWPTLCPPGC